MLFPKQWSRILGAVLAAIVFVPFLLEFREYIPHPRVEMASKHSVASPPPPPPPPPLPPPSEAAPTRMTETVLDVDDVALPPAKILPARPTDFGLPGSRPRPQRPTAVTNIFPVRATSAGATPGLRKAVVVGRMSSDDTTWIAQQLADWESSMYVVDLPAGVKSPTGLRTKVNKANEATPYLTYIIEHYADLPDVAAFVHSSSISWHNDAPFWNVANMLLWLNTSTVEQRGFVNLRCQSHPGCPNELQLNRSLAPDSTSFPVENAFPHVFGAFFNMSADAVRDQYPIIATPCCAQFAVSRAQILQRPKEQYARWLRLIEASELDSHVLGTVMEYMWHLIFGRDAVHCEQESHCRAALYGWGNPADWPESPLPLNFAFGAVGPPGPPPPLPPPPPPLPLS